jgi:hypothetical protein
MVLHLALGGWLGFPAYVQDPPSFSGAIGVAVQQLAAIAPLITVGLVTFNFAVVFQEFQRVSARAAAESPTATPSRAISRLRAVRRRSRPTTTACRCP